MLYVGLEHLRPETRQVRSWGHSSQVTSTKTPFRKGDVLFGKLRPNLRKVAFADFDGVCSTDILALRPRSNCHQQYLYWLLASDDVLRASLESAAGNVMPRTSWTDLANTFAVVPPLPEQKKIAAILTSVDEVIEKTEAQIAKLQDLKTAMMQELLTKGIGHTDFKDSPVGRIPASWSAMQVSELIRRGYLAKIQDGNHGELHPKASDYVPDGIPFVMANDLKDGRVQWHRTKKIPEHLYRNLRIGFAKAGDVLLTHKATIGEVAVVPSDVTRCMLTPQVTYYRVLDCRKLSSQFLEHVLTAPVFQSQLKRIAGQSTRDYVGITAQKELYILVPNSADEQARIANILSALQTQVMALKNKRQSMGYMKKALMQDLLTGRVRVKV